MNEDLIPQNQDEELKAKYQKSDQFSNHKTLSNEFSIDDLEKSLQDYINQHPEEKPIISTELHLIIEKELKKPLLMPSIDPSQKSKLNETLKKILKITGFSKKKHQIPIRNLFDKASSVLHIPFPILTRKTEDARLQWASIHWNKLEPYLIELFHPESQFSYEDAVVNP